MGNSYDIIDKESIKRLINKYIIYDMNDNINNNILIMIDNDKNDYDFNLMSSHNYNSFKKIKL